MAFPRLGEAETAGFAENFSLSPKITTLERIHRETEIFNHGLLGLSRIRRVLWKFPNHVNLALRPALQRVFFTT